MEYIYRKNVFLITGGMFRSCSVLLEIIFLEHSNCLDPIGTICNVSATTTPTNPLTRYWCKCNGKVIRVGVRFQILYLRPKLLRINGKTVAHWNTLSNFVKLRFLPIIIAPSASRTEPKGFTLGYKNWARGLPSPHPSLGDIVPPVTQTRARCTSRYYIVPA